MYSSFDAMSTSSGTVDGSTVRINAVSLSCRSKMSVDILSKSLGEIQYRNYAAIVS